MQRISICLVAFMTLLSIGCAKMKVVHVTPGADAPTTADGLIYALPNTVVRVNLKVDKTTATPAPYRKFAKVFAPDGKLACDEECTEKDGVFSIQDGATFSTYGEPDPQNIYVVKFAARGAIDQNLTISWNETGVITAASAQVTNRTADVVISGLKLAASLGTKAAFGAPEVLDNETRCSENGADADEAVLPRLRKIGIPYSYQIIRNYCALAPDKRKEIARGCQVPPPPKVKPDTPATATGDAAAAKKPVKNGPPPHDGAAATAAPPAPDQPPCSLDRATNAFVKEIQPDLLAVDDITSGVKPVYQPADLVNLLQARITDKVQRLYLGTKKTETWDGMLDVRQLFEDVPTATPPKLKRRLLDVVLVSTGADNKTVCIARSLVPAASKPIPTSFKNTNSTSACDPGDKTVTLRMGYDPEKEKQIFSLLKVDESQEGFRYRIPAQVRARLELDEFKKDKNSHEVSIIGSGLFRVGQLGTVVALPASRHSKSLSYDLAFIEETGGLKTFKLGTTGALDAATVDALSGIGGTILDARNKAQQNDSEQSVLTREDAIIKLKDEICTIQKKYGVPCTVQPQ